MKNTSNEIILAKLVAAKENLVSPAISDFWCAERKLIGAAKGMNADLEMHMINAQLSEDEKEAVYKEGTKKYDVAASLYYEQLDAIKYAIEHYKGQIKLDLALSFIQD